MGPHEPAWTEEDRAKVIAFMSWDAEVCKLCGSRDEDWLDPVTKVWLPEPRLVIDVAECFGCEELADARQQMGEHARRFRPFLRPRRPGEADPTFDKRKTPEPNPPFPRVVTDA